MVTLYVEYKKIKHLSVTINWPQLCYWIVMQEILSRLFYFCFVHICRTSNRTKRHENDPVPVFFYKMESVLNKKKIPISNPSIHFEAKPKL